MPGSNALPPPSTASAPPPTALTPLLAPAPASRPETPQLVFLEKVMFLSAAAVPATLACIPFFVYLMTGSVETAVNIFRTPTLYAGAVNCIIWLFYSQLIRIADLHADELVISNCFSLAFSYSFLMIAYGFRRSVWKGILLTLIVIPAMVYLFVALRFEVVLHETWEPYLVMSGFFTVLGCHVSQIADIAISTGGLAESLITAINILPNLVFNGCVCYWSWWISEDANLVIWFQSLMNFMCCLLEVVLLIVLGFRRAKAVEVMGNVDENDDSNNQMPLIPLHGRNSTSNFAAFGNTTYYGENSGSAIAARCPGQDVPLGLRIVPTLPASISKDVAVTSAPETDGGINQPTSIDEILERSPLLDPTHVSSSSENTQVNIDRDGGGKTSKASKTYQMQQEARGTERAQQPGANSAPVVRFTRCFPQWRRRKDVHVLSPIV